ncbi:hypothetical protein [Mycobacterium sp. E3305]|uniref:hypothetical protein n=1 Tax=Mycobacterium sp. E3305 TaxID=1834145 RepID=UPI000800AFDC|nr:hypothetical protein [Mycobacterium sp. E3305]OBG79102.1 hypothetical protein A5701_14465 [Mycobacterium sp. E3305]
MTALNNDDEADNRITDPDPTELWNQLGRWADYNGTEGYVPTRVAYQLGTRETCLRLVDAGRCDEQLTGYRLLGWTPSPDAAPPGHRSLLRRPAAPIG